MSRTLKLVQELVSLRKVRISSHGYDELAADGILATEVVDGVSEARVVEDYPSFPKGPCVLVLQRDSKGLPIHAVWGIPRGATAPAVLVTAYRPDDQLWTSDFTWRKK